jgi:hypothetical protein
LSLCRLAAASANWPTGRTRLLLRLRERHEVFVRHWIFVLLAQEFLFDQHVDAWRIRVRELLLKHPDGVRDLFTSEDKLFFLFALHHLLPGRHRHRHHDGHDGNADEQGRHRIACIRARARVGTPFVLTS